MSAMPQILQLKRPQSLNFCEKAFSSLSRWPVKMTCQDDLSRWPVKMSSLSYNYLIFVQGEAYHCSVDPGCNYVTTKVAHLKNHEKAHKGEKAFSWWNPYLFRFAAVTECKESFWVNFSVLVRLLGTLNGTLIKFENCSKKDFNLHRFSNIVFSPT